ncbi:putative pectinesterase/pectinesterase inhibitor 41 [Silene latifolia]|uniref:putative pectinesterase/pectinesterase inhibitor 41 n=1 Tax=Silene latifolia TaxID=37657 RepID=UPI003D7744DD
MTTNHSIFLQTLTSLIIFHFLIIHTRSLSPPPPPATPTNATTPVPASTVCQSTQYPGYCSNVLKSDNQTANVYEYGRFSFKRSISQATKFLKLVNKYIAKSRKLGLTPSSVGALQDCQFLAQLNLDFLTTSFQSVNTTQNKTISLTKAEDVQTFLSGILTNQQTCIDGLTSAQSSGSIQSGLNSPLLNDTKLYSVALTLFNKAWVPRTKKKPSHNKGRKRSPFQDGHLPSVKMSAQTRTVLEASLRNRRLLDGGDDDEGEVLISDVVMVSLDGSGNFTAVNDAVAAAPNNTDGSEGYFLIYVTAGIYEENVSIDKKKKYIMMIGDGINQTIITGNRSVVDNFTTFNSATFAVVGTGFVGINITIQNTAGAIKHQAVALRNGADLSTFYSCSFEAYQDTLYVHSLRQFYRECDIYGTVDFIFGNANVVFQNCNLFPRLPMANQFNAITAQGRTDPNQNTGISIQNCTIRAADDLASSNSSIKTYLGRPWKQYSRTVYLESFISDVVDPSGWRDWNGTFALDTLYYGEYNNTGLGSNTTSRVTWPGFHIMNATDAANFTVSSFIFGDQWLDQTGVPFFSGLL